MIVAIATSLSVTAAEDTLRPLQDGKAPQTFEERWAPYDPRREPLETKVLKEWEEDGAVLRVVRFRIGVFKGQKALLAGVTDQAKPKDKLVVPSASWSGFQEAGDWVEFDIALAPGSLRRGCFYAPIQGPTENPTVFFKRGDAVDQFGREQARGPEPTAGPGQGEHRVIGLCSYAPGPLGQHAVVFSGGKPGTYRLWLDNLRIRHADGRTSPIEQLTISGLGFGQGVGERIKFVNGQAGPGYENKGEHAAPPMETLLKTGFKPRSGP